MKAKVEVTMDNAAFHEGAAGAELARILREAADKIQDVPMFEKGNTYDNTVSLRDINGNTVGKLTIR